MGRRFVRANAKPTGQGGNARLRQPENRASLAVWALQRRFASQAAYPLKQLLFRAA